MTKADEMRFACDAMCGGLARWLRAIGYDTTYEADVDDAALVAHADQEGRVLISADGRLFERRAITSGRVRALRLPRGLTLREQLDWVVQAMRLPGREPRCTACNGTLSRVGRDEVQGIVPARSLIWANEFYRCRRCDKVFWNGTHWVRMQQVRDRLSRLLEPQKPPGPA